ncbi:piggyBac transposable element-derived protein 3-like [Rhopalosiphum padi]|uniref:piggyBac transposable element-derived protein 3-like n=1 Tax=Rhopalosiphum padi TaxID=40932 RepID=UPI00298E4905|nr:piggyBac transposable element-derived protein 3-like [Rhopalosiphum padi]
MGRGTSFEIKSIKNNDCSVGILKWYDNKPVNIASNFISSGNSVKIKRWDKKNKQYAEIERPEIISLYNKSMGGVDKIDQLIITYRTFIKSKKWTLRLITNAFDMVVANCWLQYLEDANLLKVQKNKTLELLHFRLQLVNELIYCGKSATPKRKGRLLNNASPKSGQNLSRSSDSEVTRQKLNRTDSAIPSDAIRYDTIDHIPAVDRLKNPTKCKNPECSIKHRTHTFCEKCDVHLCLSSDRNCFKEFHTKK